MGRSQYPVICFAVACSCSGRPAERLCQLAVRVVFLPRVLVRQVERSLVELQQRRHCCRRSPILAGRVACCKSLGTRVIEELLALAYRDETVPPDIAKLRAALQQRAAEWTADLRADPRIARMVLSQLVGSLTLWDDSERLDFVKWEAHPTTGLLAGLAPTLEGSSPAGPSPFSVVGRVAA